MLEKESRVCSFEVVVSVSEVIRLRVPAGRLVLLPHWRDRPAPGKAGWQTPAAASAVRARDSLASMPTGPGENVAPSSSSI